MGKPTITFFDDVHARTKREQEVSWPNGFAKLLKSTTALTKSRLPLWKMAIFGNDKTDEDCLRHDSNVLAITGIEVDYDGGQISFEDAVAKFKDANLKAIVSTTPSHTADNPHWRAILLTSKSLSPNQRAKLVARVNGMFDGALAPESFALSQSYYFGQAADGAPLKIAIVDGNNEFTGGDFIDKRKDLDEFALGPPEKGGHPYVDPDIDWAKVETCTDWCKSADDLPTRFHTKGRAIVAFQGDDIGDLNKLLKKSFPDHDPYKSWSEVTLALAGFAKRAWLSTEQIAALLQADLPCNQHVLKFSEADERRSQQRAISRAISRAGNPGLVLSRATPMDTARAYVATSKAPLLLQFGEFYEWQGRLYKALTDEEMHKRLYDFLERARVLDKDGDEAPYNPKREDIEQVKFALKALVKTPDRTPPVWLADEPDHGPWVACKNGLLNLNTRKLIDHTPDYFNTSALSFDYDRKAKPDAMLQFLNGVWPKDREAIATLQQMFGYVISGDRSHQKIFLLVGARRAGKSTIGNLLHQLVGPQASASPSLQSLSNRFGLQPLINKILAVLPDERQGAIKSPSVVTSLLKLSGQDQVTVDRKMLPQWTGHIPVCFVIISNEVPELRDDSRALAARFIVLKFEQTFLHREDRTLGDKLRAELPGILNWAIAGWKNLKEKGAFVQPKSGEAALKTFEDKSSPVHAFVSDCCVRGSKYRTRVKVLYDRYCEWTPSDPSDERAFGQQIKELGIVKSRQSRGNKRPLSVPPRGPATKA